MIGAVAVMTVHGALPERRRSVEALVQAVHSGPQSVEITSQVGGLLAQRLPHRIRPPRAPLLSWQTLPRLQDLLCRELLEEGPRVEREGVQRLEKPIEGDGAHDRNFSVIRLTTPAVWAGDRWA